jgi:PST family polysaccharide transporter
MAANATPDADARFQTDHLQADIGSRSVRGGALAIGTQGAKFILNLLSTIALARLIAPADHGLVFATASVTGFIGLVKEFGLPTAAIQKAKVDHRLASTLFWLNVAAGLGTTLLTAAIAPLIAWFYGERRLTLIAIVTGCAYLVDAFGVQHDALLRRQMRFGAYAVTEIVATVLGLAAAVALALWGFGYWALVLRQMAMSVVKTIGVWIGTGWVPGPPARRTGARALLKSGSEMTGESLLLYLSRNLDNVLIGWRWGSAELGVYGRVYYLLLLPVRQIIWPLESVTLPLLSRLVDDPARYRSAYLRTLEKIAMLTMPGAILAVAMPDWIIRVFLGPKWSDAAPILAFLGIAALTEPVLNSTNWLFISQGRTNELLRSGLASACLIIGAIVAGLRWHATGVAAAIALSSVLLRTPLLIGWVGRTGPVSAADFYGSIAPAGIAAAGVFVALEVFRHAFPGISAPVGLGAGCALGAVVSLLIFLALPAGRAALADARHGLVHLRRK